MSTSDAPKPKSPKRWLTAIKLAVTIVLVALVVWHTDWARFAATARQANIPLLVVVLGLMVLSVTISTYKWKLLLNIHDVNLPFGRLHSWYFIGVFYNNFLPSSIGGDGYRIYKTLDNGRSRAAAVVAVFVERFSGVIGLLLICYIAAAILYLRTGDWLSKGVVLVGTIGGAAALILLLVLGRTGWIGRFAEHPRCPQKLRTLIELAGDFKHHPGACVWVGVVTMLFHFHQIFFFWLLIYALGTTADILVVAVIQALTSILSILPVTINGIGLVDGSFAELAQHYRLGFEVGLATILIVRVFNMLISLIGAYFNFTGERAVPDKIDVSPAGDSTAALAASNERAGVQP